MLKINTVFHLFSRYFAISFWIATGYAYGADSNPAIGANIDEVASGKADDQYQRHEASAETKAASSNTNAPVTAPVAPVRDVDVKSSSVPAAVSVAQAAPKPSPVPPLPEEFMPPTLVFSKTPIGNVVRIFSARLNLPITIDAACDKLITGSYGNLDLRKALADVAEQAGLIVLAIGPKAEEGYSLVKPGSAAVLPAIEQKGIIKATVADAQRSPNLAATDVQLSELARRRARLLKQREALQAEEQHLGK